LDLIRDGKTIPIDSLGEEFRFSCPNCAEKLDCKSHSSLIMDLYQEDGCFCPHCSKIISSHSFIFYREKDLFN
jgi:hypothetical protein